MKEALPEETTGRRRELSGEVFTVDAHSCDKALLCDKAESPCCIQAAVSPVTRHTMVTPSGNMAPLCDTNVICDTSV